MIPRLVFHHINKCAGTTLLYALRDRFDHDACVFVETYFSRAGFAEFDFPDFEDVARARFVHEPSGSRDWKTMLANVVSFTMLRDPIDRLYSQWMMIRQWPDAIAAAREGGEALRESARRGFHEFLGNDDRNAILDRWNGMTGYLMLGDREMVELWRALEIIRDEHLARRALDLAIANLERIDILGIVERFEETLEVLALELPFSAGPTVQTHNARGAGGYRAVLDADSLSLVEQSTTLDRRLYEVALARFSEQKKRREAEFGPDLTAAARERYESSFARTPDWALVSMGDALKGSGWQAREVNGAKLSRWIGPRPTAELDVDVAKRGQMMIRARCTGFRDPAQLEQFAMRADGVPLRTETWIHLDRFRYFEAVVDAADLRAGAPLHLEFDCAFTRPAPDPRDPRLLGLEFCEIEIGPLAGFRRGAPGTPSR